MDSTLQDQNSSSINVHEITIKKKKDGKIMFVIPK